MKQLSKEEIRKITLDMMDHIHTLCEEHHIQYTLMYGTLIGAVRHNGFIPWDDDFDIAMRRQDFIRFCKLAEEEKHPYYRLCNRRNTDNYYFGIPRYADTRYHYVTELEALKNADIGVFIDVYPLDECGNSPEEAQELNRRCRKLDTDYVIYTNRRSVQGGLRTMLRTPVYLFDHMKYGPDFREHVDEMIYQIIQESTSPQDKYIGLASWDSPICPFEKQWFDKLVLHDFEDRQYYIPAEYDNVLRAQYGDYMKLPPEEERHATHDYKIYEYPVSDTDRI